MLPQIFKRLVLFGQYLQPFRSPHKQLNSKILEEAQRRKVDVGHALIFTVARAVEMENDSVKNEEYRCMEHQEL